MSWEKLLEALAATADGVCVLDAEQRVVFWNRSAQLLLGFAFQEVTGKPGWQVLEGQSDQGDQAQSQIYRAALTALAGVPVPGFDTCVQAQTGAICWINVSTVGLSDVGEQADAFVIFLFRDVTARKRQEEFVGQVLDAVNTLQSGVPAAACPQSTASTSPEADHVDLTEREREVLNLLARGLTTEDIALSLSISPHTARNHIQNILTKLQVHSRLEAVAYAIEQGIFP